MTLWENIDNKKRKRRPASADQYEEEMPFSAARWRSGEGGGGGVFLSMAIPLDPSIYLRVFSMLPSAIGWRTAGWEMGRWLTGGATGRQRRAKDPLT